MSLKCYEIKVYYPEIPSRDVKSRTRLFLCLQAHLCADRALTLLFILHPELQLTSPFVENQPSVGTLTPDFTEERVNLRCSSQQKKTPSSSVVAAGCSFLLNCCSSETSNAAVSKQSDQKTTERRQMHRGKRSVITIMLTIHPSLCSLLLNAPQLCGTNSVNHL